MFETRNTATGALAFVAALAIGGCDSGAPPVENAAAPAEEPVAFQEGNDFPSGFEGRWGVLETDCTSPVRGASEMFVVINGDRLKFHDRTGTVTEMTAKSPEQVTTRIDFSGRGETWYRKTDWYLEDDGKSLVRADKAPAVTMTYSRCD